MVKWELLINIGRHIVLVSVYCKDAEGSAEPRTNKLSAHLRHIEAIEDKIKVAGPVVGSDGEEAVASLLVLEVDNLDQANEMVKADPYYQAGVWREINIQEFKDVVGSWVGGKSW